MLAFSSSYNCPEMKLLTAVGSSRPCTLTAVSGVWLGLAAHMDVAGSHQQVDKENAPSLPADKTPKLL